MITATLPLPPAANNLFLNMPGKGRVKAPAYRAWIEEAGMILRLAIRAKQIDGPYALYLRIGKPDNRKRDLGNLLKGLEDLIVSVGAVRDDSDCQRIEMAWTDEHDDVFVRVIPTHAVPARNLRPGRALIFRKNGSVE